MARVAWNTFRLLCTVLSLQGAAGIGYCKFPAWLRAPDGGGGGEDAGDGKKWITRTEFTDTGEFWSRQREVTIRESEIIIRIFEQQPCVDDATSEQLTCVSKRLLHRLICLAEEPDARFRVQIQRGEDLLKPKEERGDDPAFTCLQFVRHNDNVLQMFYAPKSSVNEDWLCHAETLQRDPWPWIAATKSGWSFCPFEGGFDFRSHLNGEKRKMCRREWKPARIESECILGEGVTITFPQQKCNWFKDMTSQLEHQLYCWGSWTEADFLFTVMGRDGMSPQYVLRTPKDMTTDKEFDAVMYFSPVAPLGATSLRIDGVSFADMTMTRSDFQESADPGTCFDESEKCAEFAQQGKCINHSLHEYANYCKKSCGLCGGLADFAPSAAVECRFPDDYMGEWTMYERERSEQVTVSSGELHFSRLGTFICKGRHWERNLYKMFSVFKNGCRPRYSCMNFRRDGDLLLYRLSHSRPTDNSFDMCEFHDDPEPLGNKIRSSDLKVLLPLSHTQLNTCGIGGLLRVNTTFPDGMSCTGTLTDWDPESCTHRPYMSLSLYSCPKGYFEDFQCEAHVVLQDGSSILISTATDAAGSKVYQCWLIKTYIEGMPYRPWSRANLVNRGQCGGEDDFRVATHQTSLVSVQSFSDKVDRKCGYVEKPWREKPWNDNAGSSPRANTLPMYLHDIITKAPLKPPPGKPAPTTPPENDPSDNGRLPRNELPPPGKPVLGPQQVTGGGGLATWTGLRQGAPLMAVTLIITAWLL